MVEVSATFLQKKRQQVSQLHTIREDYRAHWQDLANFYLPQRYVRLTNGDSDRKRRANLRNSYILDPTGVDAAQTLGAGMQNGITSPARPWFRLRIANFQDELNHPARVWLDEVVRRMLRVMAESNFYKAIGTMYLELGIFGTSATLIYEDPDEVIRCYNSPLGEYYIAQGAQQKVSTFARRFTLNIEQVVERWGIENVSMDVAKKFKEGGDRLYDNIEIEHIIEPNVPGEGVPYLMPQFRWREIYYERTTTGGNSATERNKALDYRGFREFPCIAPRWDTTANDTYGTNCPGMQALPDLIQLQHETKAKGRLLDIMSDPPLVVDSSLKGKPNALVPGGRTYVKLDRDTAGARPAYQVNPPYGEISQDIQMIQARVREAFHNDLFRNIMQLDTVRSATEIEAREAERLVLLGPVLGRFENEALDPAIKRIYNIMQRAGLLPPVPEELNGAEVEIQYVSILNDAQQAVSTAPIERYLAFTGEMAGAFPDVQQVPNAVELNRIYAERLGVPAEGINSREQVDAQLDAQNANQDMAQAAQMAETALGGAQQLSQTEVGGGANALELLLGGSI